MGAFTAPILVWRLEPTLEIHEAATRDLAPSMNGSRRCDVAHAELQRRAGTKTQLDMKWSFPAAQWGDFAHAGRMFTLIALAMIEIKRLMACLKGSG